MSLVMVFQTTVSLDDLLKHLFFCLTSGCSIKLKSESGRVKSSSLWNVVANWLTARSIE